MILLYIDKPATLSALIRASPSHYALFRHKGQKFRVIASVLTKAVLPELLPLAIRVCQAGVVAGPASRQEDCKSVRARDVNRAKNRDLDQYFIARRRKMRVRTFMRRHRSRMIYLKQEVGVDGTLVDRDHKLLLSLLKLVAVTDWFIDEYVSNARALVEYDRQVQEHGLAKPYVSAHGSIRCINQKSLEPTQSIYSIQVPAILSKSEHGRIQRAFFHFELYRRIMGGLYRLEYHDVILKNARISIPYRRVLLFLSRQEKEELLPVVDYLIFRVQGLYILAKSYAEAKVRKTPEADGRMNNISKSIWECWSSFSWKSLLSLCESQNIGEEKARSNKFSFLTELGLPFCKSLLQINVEDQIRILALYNRDECILSIKDDLESDCIGCRFLPYDSRPLPASEACKMTKKWSRIFLCKKEFVAVQQRGYIFWDQTCSLDSLWRMLTASPLSTARHQGEVKVTLSQPNAEDNCRMGKPCSRIGAKSSRTLRTSPQFDYIPSNAIECLAATLPFQLDRLLTDDFVENLDY